MTDMRATERLLEVIEERAMQLGGEAIGLQQVAHAAWFDDKSERARLDGVIAELVSAIAELRRRGDTLVRRDDLRVVAEAATLWCRDRTVYPEGVAEVIDRLENAIGGKL